LNYSRKNCKTDDEIIPEIHKKRPTIGYIAEKPADETIRKAKSA